MFLLWFVYRILNEKLPNNTSQNPEKKTCSSYETKVTYGFKKKSIKVIV